MPSHRLSPNLVFAFLTLSIGPCCGQLTPEQWGAPPVQVSHTAGQWTIAGRKNTVVLDEKDLSIVVHA